jgi:hypothetical protein
LHRRGGRLDAYPGLRRLALEEVNRGYLGFKPINALGRMRLEGPLASQRGP